MRAALSSLFASTLLAACAPGSPGDPTGPGGQSIHPQPQPNERPVKFTSPCTEAACGSAPEGLEHPHCKPIDAECAWSGDASVSYRVCPEDACDEPPTADVCPSGTTFKGSACGSENEGACAWTTACVPPPSTTPCPDPEACGDKPEIGVVCGDGSMGDLACMQLDARCGWQTTCE